MSQKPNILLIMVDQQRYDCIGYSQDYPVHTPNIDKLASEGIWFSNAYTPLPFCCPARQSLLNGRRAEEIGALWNYDGGLKTPTLAPTEYTWSQQLKNEGYRTGYVGKWHVSPTHEPTAYGFDRYVSLQEYARFRRDKYPDATFTNGWFGEMDPVPLEHSKTHWTAEKTIEMIQEYTDDNQPWHIRLDMEDPHLPCNPTEKFYNMYDPQEVPMWRNFEETFKDKPYIQKQQLYSWGIENYTWDDWAPIVARYYGIISQLDDAVGRVLHALDQLGIAENTMVIFTSDHGDLCGGHRMMDKQYVLYDDIVKVPLAMRWPEQIKPGQINDNFVYNILDLPPTILETVDLKPKEFFRGRSLLPFLKGEAVSDWRQEVVSTYNGGQFGAYTQRMIRNTEWKYVWNTTAEDELYHLSEDPDELVNLINRQQYTEVITELRRKLYTTLQEEGDTLVNNQWIKHQLLNEAIL